MISIVDYKNIKDIKVINEHVNSFKPLLVRNIDALKLPCKKWTPEYIASLHPNLEIPVKQYGSKEQINIQKLTLLEYSEYLKECNNSNSKNEKILYCHDIPIFSLINELISDITPFFLSVLPKWYHEKWWRYVQFFMGPQGSWTPLHFDCLLTNNIFFQIRGKKVFTLIKPNDGKYCGRYNWRWFEFNPEKPDYHKFSNMSSQKIQQIIIGPGDMLYMPPGMLHSVKGLEESISFNIDFHTNKSVAIALTKIFFGMPKKNWYYNLICALGLILKIPSKYLFSFYKSYLNYVS